MDDFEKGNALVDANELNDFLELVESCDSEEAKEALEASLLNE